MTPNKKYVNQIEQRAYSITSSPQLLYTNNSPIPLGEYCRNRSIEVFSTMQNKQLYKLELRTNKTSNHELSGELLLVVSNLQKSESLDFKGHKLSNTIVKSLTQVPSKVETKFYKNTVPLKNSINTLSMLVGRGSNSTYNNANNADILAKVSDAYSKKDVQELAIIPSEENKVFNTTHLIAQLETLGLVSEIDTLVNSSATIKLFPHTKNTLKPIAKNSLYAADSSYSIYINKYRNKINDALSVICQMNLESLIYTNIYCQINNIYTLFNNSDTIGKFHPNEESSDRESVIYKKIPEYIADLESKHRMFEINRNKFKTASYYLFNKIINNTLKGTKSSDSTSRLVLDPNYRDTNTRVNVNTQSLINNLSINSSTTDLNGSTNNSAHLNQNSIEESLQIFETTLAKHLGSDYIRSVIYSHYGSWLPKYGVYVDDNNNKSSTKAVLSNMIDSGD